MAFHPLVKTVDLYEGCRIPFKVGRWNLLVVQADERPYIIEDRCPHMDVPLSYAVLTGTKITCKAHGITFALTDGKAEGPLSDTLDCLTFFEIVYEGIWLGVDL